MTDNAPRPINPHFVADLRRALNHLYDPDELRRNPLFAALGTLARGSPSLLREALIALIAELKPRAGLSPDADAWRVYRTLHHRFVEQFTQAEAATTLGVSIRQVRRQESQALRVLADLLWTRYPLQALYSDISEQSADEELEDEEPPTIDSSRRATKRSADRGRRRAACRGTGVAGPIAAFDRGPVARIGGHGLAHRGAVVARAGGLGPHAAAR